MSIKPERPDHYKIVSISLYTEDLNDLKAAVEHLKRKERQYKENQSSVIRRALQEFYAKHSIPVPSQTEKGKKS